MQMSLNEDNPENGQEEPDPATVIDVYVSTYCWSNNSMNKNH